MLKSFLSACALVAPIVPALADEAWYISGDGPIYYETNVGETAVFRFDEIEGIVRLYIPGLANSLNERGTHTGYWMDDRDSECEVEMTGPDGLKSKSWGMMILTFDRETFPTGWTALVGKCFDAPDFGLRANLLD